MTKEEKKALKRQFEYNERTKHIPKEVMTPLFQKIYNEENYKIAISIFENAPKNEITQDIICLIATAYNNIGGDDNYRKAISLLKSVENKTFNELIRLYRLIFAYHHLNEEDECIENCLIALDLVDKHPELDVGDYLRKICAIHERFESDDYLED